MFTPERLVVDKFLAFLKEDVGQGDATTDICVPPDVKVEAEIVAKEEGVAAGVTEATAILRHFGFKVDALVADGDPVKPKMRMMHVSGDARTLLSLERTLLNLLSRMCGIATATKFAVATVKKAGFKTRVASTRKTAPGLLYFDKKAVAVGGGDTHRLHLDDLLLVKDNHIAVAGSITQALKQAKTQASFAKKIEIEVTTADDAVRAAKNGADIIMLDNFTPKEVKEALKLLKKKELRGVVVEASGGITLENLVEYAATGVDVVSLGELTDSARPLDISLEILKKTRS